MILDPLGTLTQRPLRLELGCGLTKRHVGSVGVDVIVLPGVDVVGDACEVLRSLPDESVEWIYSEHFLEHVDDPLVILTEAARVLKSGGKFRAIVPHFSNPAFYSDPTHRSFFGLYTFGYWIEDIPYRRKVPQYTAALPFSIISTRHTFKSSPPFYLRHAIKRATSWWVNMNLWTQEFYEEHLCWLMPCYELDYQLVRLHRPSARGMSSGA